MEDPLAGSMFVSYAPLNLHVRRKRRQTAAINSMSLTDCHSDDMEAVFGLAGIIIGSVLSWAGVTWSERVKRRHEGRILVRNEKLQAYSSFTSAAKAYVALLYSVAAYFKIDEQTEKLSVEQAAGLLDEAFRARDRAFEQILLVGSDEIIASARAWVQLIYLMRNYLDSPTTSRADWVAHVDRANDARSAFYAQARKELAVA